MSVGERRGIVLDAGAFIALEKRDETMTELVRRFTADKIPLVTSAGVVGQIWRGGGTKQVPIVYLLRRTRVVDLTYTVARALGRLLHHAAAHDVVDAHVALIARERDWSILTSDPDDLGKIDPGLELHRI